VRESTVIRSGKLARRAGVGRLASATTPRPNLRISLTHHVRPEDRPQLRRILCWIGGRRAFMTPAEFFECFERGVPLRSDAHLVTFDDGLLSSYEAAQQVLNPLGIRAFFFVPTRVLDLETPDEMQAFAARRIYRSPGRADRLEEHHYLTMTREHLRHLHRQGHRILPHTHSHVALSELTSDADVDMELRRPKALLEDLLQAPARGFAFPVGTERVVTRFAYDHVRATYRFCFLGLSGANTTQTDPSYLHRDCIHPHFPLSHVRNVMDGVYDPFYAIKLGRLKRRTCTFPFAA
jgi:peptidoglycan/xylan/chitin deacetylase (PgdA/CDA1 family)